MTAASDSRYMGPIADDIYRFQPLVLSVDATKMIHGTDEHISVECGPDGAVLPAAGGDGGGEVGDTNSSHGTAGPRNSAYRAYCRRGPPGDG
jgi:hypothetical protein